MNEKQNYNFNEKTSDKICENVKEAFEKLEQNEDIQNLKVSAKEVADIATDFIRKYPLQSVIGAAVVGFILANIINKKNS